MIRSLIILLTVFTVSALVFAPRPAAAQTCTDPSTSNCVDVFNDVCQNGGGGSPACQDKNLNGGNPIYGPQGLIVKIFNIISLITGLAAVISIIAAGMKFVTSGSNPEEVNKAREYIQYAVIGLAVAALSQALVKLVLTRISL
jgi:hypothetical protein